MMALVLLDSLGRSHRQLLAHCYGIEVPESRGVGGALRDLKKPR